MEDLSKENHGLIAPYGGKLKDLMVQDSYQKDKLIAKTIYKHECTERNACDIELLIIGAFSPLEGFMDEENYKSVVNNNRDTNNFLFGLPVVLDTNNSNLKIGETILLTYKGQDLGILEITSKWEPDKSFEAKNCYGTNSLDHPAVKMIFHERGKYYLGGRVHGFELPKREFPCATP